MAMISHGSNLSLAPTLGPIVRATGSSFKETLGQLSSQGFSSVQLDATLQGVRPRELDRRARKDLAGSISRAGLAMAGLDLFIPRQHFLDAEHVDRALSAACDAIELAGELGHLPLSLSLPVTTMDADVCHAILSAGDGHGVKLIVHQEDDADGLSDWMKNVAGDAAAPGLDPAAALGSRVDPVELAQGWSNQIVVGRLSDTQVGLADGSRLAVGEGGLQLMLYRLSMDMAANRHGPMLLDLRGLSDPWAAANKSKQAWESAAIDL